MSGPDLLTNAIGYTAAVIGTILMLPQVVKAVQTRKMDDVSQGTVILYFLNCLLWLAYNILINAWPAIIANAIGLVISIIQWRLKSKYG